ncbi:METTL5 (predicted) [Pycnogonum litorale]
MSFQAPNSKQESQNRKILEELQQQKKMLMSNSKTVPNPSVQNQSASAISQLVVPNLASSENHAMTQSQRAAIQHAHQQSTGYFITQDSSFGNLILPVLPRCDTNATLNS